MPATAAIDRRIFIVGCPRSGTTLVQSLLASHSTVTSFTESHFFSRHFVSLPFRAGAILARDPSARLREFLAENDEAPPEAARWFDAEGRRALRLRPLLPFQTRSVAQRLLRVLDELTMRRGRSGWIEKTPMHLRYLAFLERMSRQGEQMHVIHVIRDAVDAVSSLHEASRHWERHYDLEACARRWNADVSLSLARITLPTDHFVFYEELASRPEATLRQLLAALGLGWEPDIMERYASTSRRLTTAEETWKAGNSGSIRPSGAADRALTAEQRAQVSRLVRRDLYDRLRERVGAVPSAARGIS